MARVRSAERGFTLIELMVSVAILGVLTALAVSGLEPTIERVRLGQGAETVREAVAFARQAARANGRCTKVDLIANAAAAVPSTEPAVAAGGSGTALRIWRWRDITCAGATAPATAELVGFYPLPTDVAVKLSTGTELTWIGNGRTNAPPRFTVDRASAPGASGAQAVVVAPNGPSCAFPAAAVGACP